jgi:phosphatidylserine/phosphatidylglycerophosphate/cardiolipin synthase-like enzyme
MINYPELFKLSRELLKQELMTPKHQLRKRFKDLPETEVIEHLQSQPEKLSEEANPNSRAHRELINELAAEALRPADPSKHLRLIPPQGQSGYSELQFYVSHPYSYSPEGSTQPVSVPSADLMAVWQKFLEGARKQIVLNVYDFDLERIAQTLIDQGRKGLQVRVGIDKEVIAKRPQVKVIADRLTASGVVKLTAVDSVGLNHQKMAAIDWEEPERARVLFSSGNLTQSCLDPEGDLKGIQPLPPGSIPNANHVITMKSWLLANLIHHELSKTLDPDLQLRGAQYPMNGAYQVTGPEITDPANLLSEARPLHSLIISFTPGGGYRDVNSHLIARLINETEGPIRVIQFAFSADVVGEALLNRAQQAYLKKNKFDFIGIGDTPFALQSWSQFLRLSGWKLLKDKSTRKKYYVEDVKSPWYKALTASQWQDLRSKIFIGPRDYRNHTIQLPGGLSREVSAKIHHKILSIGTFAIVGTSFNFSKNAQNNNEQILIFNEPDLARRVDGMVRGLTELSGQTVSAEVERRNRFNDPLIEATEPTNPGL